MAAAAEDLKKFRPNVLVERFRECEVHSRDVPITAFVSGCEEVKKIVYSLGAAFSIASADITEKNGVLHARLKELEAQAHSRGHEAPRADAATSSSATGDATHTVDVRVRFTLQWLVLDEMRRGVHKRNDREYVSGARSLLRLMWFLDFLQALIGRLVSDTDAKELRACAQEAYDEALAPHHPWVLRKTIGAAMYLLPSKDSFMTTLAGDASSPAELRPKLREFLAVMNPVRTALWAFYDAHGIRDLP